MDYSDIPFVDCPQGSEGELLLFALDRAHWQFAWKTGGLSAEQLGRRHPPSTMTLAGLIKHLASVEEIWTARALGESPGPPWDEVDRAADPEWEWRTAVTDGPDELYDLWYRTAAHTRSVWGQIVADDRLDDTVPWGSDDYVVNLRRVLVDILEENLLHGGQASMLREAVDGLVGNDPPSDPTHG